MGKRGQRRILDRGGGKGGGGDGEGKGEKRLPWQHEQGSPGQRVAALLLSPRLSDLTITFPGRHNPSQGTPDGTGDALSRAGGGAVPRGGSRAAGVGQ
ncbi:hypothetical protein O3P69_010144 [Scylla paramamosain]|uniref:Uncharacterized protein n=1 Tax=Scylla paramamosain TaxID=85552 RepID=A0AAW0TVI2_SCYPA